MDRHDRSFHGLWLSIALHILLIWLILKAPQPGTPHNDTTEVTIIDSSEKSKSFVTETNLKPEVEERLRDEADHLSQFTRRVKKQMKARESGRSQNAGQLAKRSGMAVPKSGSEPGEMDLRLNPGGQPTPQPAIGSSSLAERIPGVQEGSFTALNTDQFTYYAFFARMNEQIRSRWVAEVRRYVAGLSREQMQDLAKIDRETIVEIVLDERGHFMQSIVVHSSGFKALDITPVAAFKDASPFLNPPHGLIESDGYIHLKYGFFIRFQPPAFGPVAN